MSEKYLLTRIYYAMDNLQDAADPNGNRLLRELIRPLIEHAVDSGWASQTAFMRFSSAGYHIRLRLWGDETVLRDEAQPYVEQQVATYLQHNNIGQDSAMALTHFAQHVNSNWNKRGQLRQPGYFESGIMEGPGEETVHESDEAMRDFQVVTTLMCNFTLKLLMHEPSYAVRQTFVRLLLDDMFRSFDLNPRERFYIFYFCEQQWTHYFRINEEIMAPYRNTYLQRQQAYEKFLAQKVSPTDSLRFLPAALRPLYMDWINALTPLAGHVIRRDELGHLNRYDALRMLGLYHLSHNRFGIGIAPEVQWAHTLNAFYGQALSDEDRIASEEATRQLLANSMEQA